MAISSGRSSDPARFEDALNKLVLRGDLKALTDGERVQYYKWICDRIGLDWSTRPFDLLVFNGKMELFPSKRACQQLASKNQLSHKILSREYDEMGCLDVVCEVTKPDGRVEQSLGSVFVGNLRGTDLANAKMKAETKAKNRGTLDMCGLGMLTPEEVEDLGARAEVSQIPMSEPPQQLPATEVTQRAVAAFATLGVTQQQLEEYVGGPVPTWDKPITDHLRDVFESIANGEKTWDHITAQEAEVVSDPKQPASTSGKSSSPAAEPAKAEDAKKSSIASTAKNSKTSPAATEPVTSKLSTPLSDDLF